MNHFFKNRVMCKFIEYVWKNLLNLSNLTIKSLPFMNQKFNGGRFNNLGLMEKWTNY